MALWKITAKEKKSSIERQIFTKGKKRIIHITGYRWGEVTVHSDKKPKYEQGQDIHDFEVEDWAFSDGSWDDYSYENMTERDIEKVDEIISEEGFSGLEEKGWEEDDMELYFNCPVKIEKVKE